MKFDTPRWASAVTALALFAAPACDDNQEAKKDDKKAEALAKADATKPDADSAKVADKNSSVDPAPAGDAKAGEAAEAAPTPADGGAAAAPSAIGVTECDDYIKRYSKCIDEHYAASDREGTRAALKSASDAWSKAAVTEEGKQGLIKACNSATAAVKAICKW